MPHRLTRMPMSTQQTELQPVTNEAPASGRRHQARSLERRLKIMSAAKTLLESSPVSSISVYDVARKAEIPPSSVYHFFPKIEYLLQTLTIEVFEAFDQCIEEPVPEEDVHHWSDIAFILETRMQRYYQSNPMARALILGQHLFGDILTADHQHDEYLGRQIQAIYEQFFELPELPETYNIFSIALQASDKVYAMSHQEFGNITDTMALEGWRVSKAYLGLYLPDQLKRKESPDTICH